MIIISISCAWVLGIILGSRFTLPSVLISTGLIPLAFIFIDRNHRKYWIVSALCLVTLFGGAIYYPASIPDNILLSSLKGQSVIELKGTISAEPEVRDNITHIELNAEQIKVGTKWEKIQGKVLLFVPLYPEYQYGDVLWLQGGPEVPPQFNTFDYQAYLARQGIFITMLYPQIKVLEKNAGLKPLIWIYTFRGRLSQEISKALPEPQAGLCKGIVLGIRTTIPETLKYNLSVTGTAQLLAISGINLSIVAGMLVALGIWIFGRKHYTYIWLALLVIWFYSLITGMEAPVVRSSIMASLFLLAELLGRQKNAFIALCLSAAVMVGLNPQILWSPSFQLSFLAMTGLIFIAPPLKQWSHRMATITLGEEGLKFQIGSFILDSFSVTLAAIIAVFPLIVYYFGIISLISPLATLLISPALPAIIITGSMTAVIGLLNAPAAQVVGWSSWLFLSYMLWLVNFFAQVPAAFLSTAPLSSGFVWLYYGILSLLIWFKTYYNKIIRTTLGLNPHITPIGDRIFKSFYQIPKRWIIVPLLLIAFLTSFTAATLPDPQLHVSILNVGEGDAILVQKEGKNILIDGGPSSEAVCQGISSKIAFWDRKIDLVILTHPHLDHLSGLVEVVKRYQVKQVLAPNLISNTALYREWMRLIQEDNVPYQLARAGQQINLDNSVKLSILNPPDDSSDNSEAHFDSSGVVLRLDYDKISFLFTADIDQEIESKFVQLRSEVKATILKVAHHGSATSSSVNFLSAVKPQAAVISVGTDNLYNHPNPEVLAHLRQQLGSGKNLFRTDTSGTIEFITNGKQLRIDTEYP